MNYKNGTEIKLGDPVVGFDHFGRPCAGVVVKGIPEQHQDDLVFKNNVHGAVQSSLSLTKFLRADEAEKIMAAIVPTKKPVAASTAK